MVHPNKARAFAILSIVGIGLILLINNRIPSQSITSGRRQLLMKDENEAQQAQNQVRSQIIDAKSKVIQKEVELPNDVNEEVGDDGEIIGDPHIPPQDAPVLQTSTAKPHVEKPDILLEDVVDNLPTDMKGGAVFPKPAPALYLSMDNNKLKPEDQLLEGLVKPIVYFVWCGKRWFTFKHYLALVSVIKAMTPDKVIFYYEVYPPVDNNLYNIWLDDLKHDFQFLEVLLMEKNYAERICRGDYHLRLQELGYLVGYEGGVYISENTWMTSMVPSRRLADVDFALDHDLEGYLMMRGGVVNKERGLADILAANSTKLNITKNSCSPVHLVYKDVQSDCVVVKGKGFNDIYPMELVYKEDDKFAALVRRLFYGTEKIRKPEPTYDVLVPNIGHMIWIGGGAMDFVFYLSLLSMLYVVKVDVVYIHGDQPPTGPYWHKINTNARIRSRIKLISRPHPSMVYQGKIEHYYRALMSDIIRVDLMIKYGGVYTDTDAIWVKPLSYEDRGYDAVATYDWVDWSYPFPDTVNFGVSYGKRNAPFYRLFRDSMRILHNDLHGYTGVAYPYKILEKHPDLIRIDRRLGVICYYSRCHPLWVKDYHNMTHDHVVAGSIKNWKEDVHAFHWTHPNPTELHNETILMTSSGMFAEIGKFVLKQAGLL